VLGFALLTPTYVGSGNPSAFALQPLPHAWHDSFNVRLPRKSILLGPSMSLLFKIINLSLLFEGKRQSLNPFRAD
jgi:hypothetical protein